MDSTIIAAMAVILGSVVGVAGTLGATWITQRTQSARSKTEATLRDRQTLYGEFITEASRLTVDAFTNQLEQPATFVTLYGILGRIRLVAHDGQILRLLRITGLLAVFAVYDTLDDALENNAPLVGL